MGDELGCADFPNDKSITEELHLLILAGPRLDTQREPQVLHWVSTNFFNLSN